MFKIIRNTLFVPSAFEDNFDATCFNIILFDIFFVPLFPWFSISVSLPILLIWYFQKGYLTTFELKRC